ncbi:D-alanyl-D-alanine carboxypeptidase family protein [Haloechinothrix sp. LS1_15]|uniref:D-alanyl-D-alanine carboxypeptidase family protein n=1 Tax=Haloechinothrix sp. LS1_15 TaxID=2652248 RepID=UPI00294529A1|nr:D-alanyl-D-alanine carboxypeptidase family protein [Haloechinothrix sp. LS1_15]MDV6012710.1 D-alanyl-D-alanine carboxypeptidase [Haloechinothrix sp. LS1_15]
MRASRASGALLAALSLALGLVVVLPAAAEDHAPSETDEVPVEAGVAPDVGVPDPRPGEAFADPEIADLQVSATEVQEELDALSGRIAEAQQELDEATARLDSATEERRAAEAELADMQTEVDDFSRTVFTAMGRPDEVRVLLTAGSPKDALAGSEMIRLLRSEQDEQLLAALERHRSAVETERKAEELEEEAAERAEELERRNTDASHRADAISSELRGPIGEANEAVIAQQEAQRERNTETAASWEAYLDRLDDAGVTLPSAAALSDPDSLPSGMRPVQGEDGEPQAGVAQVTVDGERLLVLPAETADAVSDAVDELGKPYVPKDEGTGPVAYSCDGLVHAVYDGNDLDMPRDAAAQLARGRQVPYEDAQPGDVVFVGPAKYGVQHVGIVLDDRTMLAADGRIASVAVTDLPASDSALGVIRPALGQRSQARDVPEREDGELTWRCGGVELPISTGSGGEQQYDSAGAWGGYPNGLIPRSALCSIGVGSHVLRCDAAQRFVALSAAYAEEFGDGLCVTDSYRTFDAQVDLYHRKPALAAVPGTSNHGWGLAVDLCAGVESFGTPQHRWMVNNAPAFGWIHPQWARQGGGREEPWHWEYVGRG